MKTKPAAHLSFLICMLSLNLIGTACGAAPATEASPSFTMTTTTPELEVADDRVRQAEAQLNVAKKQLNAARSLLKAAEADLRAARTAREALALQQQAQGLADEAGMTPSTAPPIVQSPRAVAAKPASAVPVEKKPVVTTAPVMTVLPPATPAEAPEAQADLKPVQSYDFNSQPLNADETTAPPPVQLR